MSETTIKDIAKQCGVGVSTVSRALNNHPDINPETRDKILAVIKETGFVPNNSARNLKKSDAKSIALLVKGISNPFFSTMIKTMEEYALKKRYSVIIRHVEATEDEVAVAIQLVKENKLRGIVFLGGNFTHNEEQLKQLKVPFIFSTIGTTKEQKEQQIPWYSNISVDDIEESDKAVSYLIEQGHRRIAIITEGLSDLSVGQLRFEGYKNALESHGVAYDENLVYVVTKGEDHYSIENGYTAARALLSREEDFTAFFCVADVFAIGACRAIVERGKRIPEDYSVIGYDGIEIGNYYNPRLTTIAQPVDEMAEETIVLLFDEIEKKRKPENIIMPAKLLIRESSGSGYRR